MPETINKESLSKIKKGDSDHERLYMDGLELLQKLSGAEWTDYNEHDPGVTILENLIYTLTGLAYKTSLPIQDILTESKGGELESGDNGFFVPSEILTTNPVASHDLRKIFIDQITNVKNVWIKSHDHPRPRAVNGRQVKWLKGLYQVYINMYEFSDDPKTLQQEKERIIGEAKALFHTHRNLCEDLYDIFVFEPLELRVKLRLTLEDRASGEKVFAHIYYAISDYLSHEVRFRSLWELKAANKDINTIFDGPSLENGFITDDELKDKLSDIVPSDIIKLIAKTQGVISVDFFEMAYKNDEANGELTVIDKNGFAIPENYSPVLLFPESNEELVFKNEGVVFSPDLKEVSRYLSYVQTMNYGSFKSVSQSINRIEIPQGTSLKASSYYSIREQFPLVYGVGRDGLQRGLPVKRYAQANQLTAYLLPFDQLMTNFLAQLTNLYKIYDIKGENLQSYFYQELEDMPKLVHLIRSNELELNEDALNNWKITLQQLNSRFDQSAIQRLNEVADNLLARFAEQFPVYALKKLNEQTYGKKLTASSFDNYQLSRKRKLIRDYGQLSYNRAKAFDYTQSLKVNDSFEVDDSLEKLTPKLVHKIAILMGIKDFSIRSLSKMMLESGITIFPKKDTITIIRETIEIINSKGDVKTIEEEEIVIVDEVAENLWSYFYFIGASENILEDVLKNGILSENYQVKPAPKKKGNAYYVSYTKEGTQHVVHITNSEEGAKKAINYCTDFLERINEKSEGIYFIEHLLLTPPYHGDYYGFSFSLPVEGDDALVFEQVRLKPNIERDRDITAIITTDPLQFRPFSINEKYAVQALATDGRPLAVTKNRYNDQKTAQQVVEQIAKQIAVSESKRLNGQVDCFAYYEEGKVKIPETFFSFQVSFILPSWPVRFQDANFRTKFNNVVYQQIPAHIAFESYWLDWSEMLAFEKIYFKWLRLPANEEVENRMAHAYKLIKQIQRYQKLRLGDRNK